MRTDKNLALAEQAGLIGPKSRTDDLHPAVVRFADLVIEDVRKTEVKALRKLLELNDDDLRYRLTYILQAHDLARD